MNKQLRLVPQIILETGLCQDYKNEFIVTHVDLQESYEYAQKNVLEKPIKKYTERYSPEEYENAVPEQATERVKVLDKIVDYVNEIFKGPAPSKDDFFTEAFSDVIKLIEDENVDLDKMLNKYK